MSDTLEPSLRGRVGECGADGPRCRDEIDDVKPAIAGADEVTGVEISDQPRSVSEKIKSRVIAVGAQKT